MTVPDFDILQKWATAIAILIILIRQQVNAGYAKDAKQHAQDAATVGIQTFHLVNGQMTGQLQRNATLANKVANLLPDDKEAQQVAKDSNEAVTKKGEDDAKLLQSNSIDPTNAVNRLSQTKSS